MKHVFLAALTAASLCACSSEVEGGGGTSIARGKYLAEHVAMCQDCHGPRGPDGALDRARWLAGAQLGFVPSNPMPWAPVAPPLAGLPGITDEQAFALLTKGVARSGKAPLPPMPPYAFADDDARAVIGYLRSLAAQ